MYVQTIWWIMNTNLRNVSLLSSQDHSGEVGSSQQVPHEPQGGKLLLQKPPAKAGGAAGKPLHGGHQVRRGFLMADLILVLRWIPLSSVIEESGAKCLMLRPGLTQI